MVSFFGKKPVHVQVVRRNEAPCLLASFSLSSPPLIWQFDLEKMSNHTIMLREKEGEWDLGFVFSEGSFTVIAHFDERGNAEEAYSAVQSAMIHGEPVSSGFALRWFASGIAVVLLGIFLANLFFVRPSEVVPAIAQAEDAEDADLNARTEKIKERLRAKREGRRIEEGGAREEAFAPSSSEPSVPPPSRKMEFGVPIPADEILDPPAE